MGCYSEVNGDKITFYGVYFKDNLGYTASITEKLSEGIRVAQKLADTIKEKIHE